MINDDRCVISDWVCVKIKEEHKMLKTKPCVFAIGDRYEITVTVTEQSVMWVKVGDKLYYDEANGIMRSSKPVHKISVPMSELDAAGEYTVYERSCS